MMTTIHAVYENGVFRPTRAISLSEGTQVEVLIPQSRASRDAKAVAKRLAAIAAGASRNGQPDFTSRDHDRYLYGEGHAE
jgi:predicted DNA-binding antitoxin AbrB/MazE fold protein